MRLAILIGLAATSVVTCGPGRSVDRAVDDLGRDAAAQSPDSGPLTATGPVAGPVPAPVGGAGPVPPTPSPLAANGVRCESDAACAFAACVDGVCCDGPCDGPCMACDKPGLEGKCLPVSENQDPDNDCTEQPVATCGLDGVCDGRGACRRFEVGTECGPGSCTQATQHAASTCDGTGRCVPGTSKSCAPAVCIDQSCGEGCFASSDCERGFFCDGGTCRRKRALTAACTLNAQCASGFCSDGVCCSTACRDICHACNLAGTVGTCMAAKEKTDPREECPVEATQTCGNDGSGCNGRGACIKHAAGARCGFASCSGFVLNAPAVCDGLGACRPGPASDCGNFVCNGPRDCWTACADNDQCRAGFTCVSYICR
jgi:hypothetical protein